MDRLACNDQMAPLTSLSAVLRLNAARLLAYPCAAHAAPTGDEAMVCKVRPNGSIECLDIEFSSETPTDPQRAAFESWVASYFGTAWCEEKVSLALRIPRQLDETPANCQGIENRSEDILGSVYCLLEQTPESMLLFNYSTLPADSLGAWVHAKLGFRAVRELHRKFDGNDDC